MPSPAELPRGCAVPGRRRHLGGYPPVGRDAPPCHSRHLSPCHASRSIPWASFGRVAHCATPMRTTGGSLRITLAGIGSVLPRDNVAGRCQRRVSAVHGGGCPGSKPQHEETPGVSRRSWARARDWIRRASETRPAVALDHPVLRTEVRQRLDEAVEVLPLMGGHQRDANPALAARDGGPANAGREQSPLEELSERWPPPSRHRR